jgi:TRAP-type C4-dicarboxylate transport system substrate-binding protein
MITPFSRKLTGWLLALATAGISHLGAQSVRLATLAPTGASAHKSLAKMGEAWSKAGVRTTIYADGKMGGESQMVRRIRLGQIQAAALTAQGMAVIDESVKSLQMLPMLFRSLDEYDHVLARIAPEIEAKFREKGFEVLFWSDLGYVQFFSKEEAHRIEDFRKMKMFVWSGDTQMQSLMKTLGMHGVPLEQTEGLTGLQTGLVDMATTAPVYALAGQFYRTANHMLKINWAPLSGGLVFDKRVWDRLPAARQQALRAAANQAGKEIRQYGRHESDLAVDAMSKRGLKVIEPTKEDLEDWYQFAQTVYPEIRGKIVPPAIFDHIQTLVKEYRAGAGK